MVDFTATLVQAKAGARLASHEGGQTNAAVTKPPNMLPPPSADGVDGLYRQLAEIHTITATQLVECAR
jgi:hypothetical protein